MKHKAAIKHGNTYMTIFPLADLRDLEIFLREGHQSEPTTSEAPQLYYFDKEFGDLTNQSVLHHALVKECSELSSALFWLHENLKTWGKPDEYLAHMDLKPDNILIHREEGHPVGKWVISDFGVSLIGRRDILKSTKTVAHRNRHGYTPPEFYQTSVDGRKCDTWSFACILCDVLAFALNRRDGLIEFRKERADRDDRFYKIQDRPDNSDETFDGFTATIKPNVVKWLQNKHTTTTSGWVPPFIEVIYGGLVPNPGRRSGIKKICNGLNEIVVEVSNGTHPRTTSTSTFHTPPQPQENSPVEAAEPSLRGALRRSLVPSPGDRIDSENSRHSTTTPSDTSLRRDVATNWNENLREEQERLQPLSNHGSYSGEGMLSHEERPSPDDRYPTRGNNRKYTELMPLTNNFNTKPLAVDLHKNGHHAAMLFHDHTRIFLTTGHRNPSLEAPISLPYNFTANKLNRIWTSESFFAVYVPGKERSVSTASLQ